MTPSGKFEAADFGQYAEETEYEFPKLQSLADRANALLDEWLEKQPIAYGDKGEGEVNGTPGTFHLGELTDMPWASHQARLVRPEEIK